MAREEDLFSDVALEELIVAGISGQTDRPSIVRQSSSADLPSQEDDAPAQVRALS